MNVLSTYVYSILLYASECWTLSTAMTKRLEAVEMWFYRKILRISYTRHITNEEVLNRMATTRIILNTVRNRQMSFFGHVIISGKVENKRYKGRQKSTYTKSLSEWMNVEEVEMIRFAGDGDIWKTMTVKAGNRRDT